MIVEVLRTRPSFVFHWPAGTEEYGPVIEVTASGSRSAKPLRLYIAYGFREAFGAVRRRILVFKNEADVLAEFVGVNSWPRDKRVATFLRRDGSKKYLRTDDPVPSRYTGFNVIHSRSIITGPYAPNCFAIVVEEADLPSLVAVAMARDEGERAAMTQSSPDAGPALEAQTRHLQAVGNYHRAVVDELLAYRSKQKTGGPFTRNKDADEFLRQNPFAFLMAASIDRGAVAEAVWEIPFLLYISLGHLDPRILAPLGVDQVEAILRSLDRQPRFPRQAAQTIVSLSKLVVDRFHGNAASIWEDREPADVVETLEEIWGVGPGIAHMLIRILVDEFGYDPGTTALRQIDVKGDTHVVRVFYRTGLILNRSEKACVEAARQLYPEFPGLLDWPAWEIGRTWCHERNPKCVGCPLFNACSKIGV